MSENKTEKRSSAGYFFRICGVLILICASVALMLSAVNLATEKKIKENSESERTKAVSLIFGEIDKPYEVEVSDHTVYLVSKDGQLAGYCVAVSPQGYGGEIDMLVGIAADGTVCGVQIVSLSETPGVGSRVKTDSAFLDQFKGRTLPLEVGDNVDAIAGASISSKAVTSGVREALSVDFDLASTAAEYGIASSGEETSAEAETTAAPETTTAADTTAAPPETTTAPEDTTNIEPNSIGYGEGYNYPLDNVDVGVHDVGETMEQETTDTESESESEPAPDAMN